LKTAQDAFIINRLRDCRGKRILEVGGGNSRILPILTESNECWLADRFEGLGRGPTDVPEMPGVRIVRDYVGDFSKELPDDYFDWVVSVSVLEHVPIERLHDFFSDCARLLRKGGHMAHAVDTYLFDEEDRSLPAAKAFRDRIEQYLKYSDRDDIGLQLSRAPAIDKDVTFSCRHASLPDNVLHRSYTNKPKQMRTVGQVVSLKTEWVKTR